MNGVATILLAGDRGPDDPLAVNAGVPGKIFAPVAGEPMIHHVMRALSQSSHVREITIVTNEAALLKKDPVICHLSTVKTVRYVETSRSPVGSILESLREDFPYLVVTADHPLMTPEMLDDFCSRALAMDGADVVAGVVPKSTVVKKYPHAKRSFIGLKGDAYKGCNFFLFCSPESRKILEFWRGIEKNRKKGWRIIWAFGPIAMLLVYLKVFNLDQLMKKASKVLGVKISTVVMSNPDCAIDVDKPGDLIDVEAALAGRSDPVAGGISL